MCDGRCTHCLVTRMAQVSVNGVCSVHVAYLRLAFSTLMFHPPSLLFPHGHFHTTFPFAPSSSSSTRSKSAGQAHLRTCAGEFGYWAGPTHSTAPVPVTGHVHPGRVIECVTPTLVIEHVTPAVLLRVNSYLLKPWKPWDPSSAPSSPAVKKGEQARGQETAGAVCKYRAQGDDLYRGYESVLTTFIGALIWESTLVNFETALWMDCSRWFKSHALQALTLAMCAMWIRSFVSDRH